MAEASGCSLWHRQGNGAQRHLTAAAAVAVIVALEGGKAVVRGQQCENIGDTSICSQERINIFKFPKRFLEISFRDLTFFATLII
jgi:hypothetical protein